jgi:hypothetical protein
MPKSPKYVNQQVNSYPVARGFACIGILLFDMPIGFQYIERHNSGFHSRFLHIYSNYKLLRYLSGFFSGDQIWIQLCIQRTCCR